MRGRMGQTALPLILAKTQKSGLIGTYYKVCLGVFMASGGLSDKVDATHSSSSGYPNSTKYYEEDDPMEDETIVASGSATHDLPTPPPEPQAVLPPQSRQHAEGRVVLSPEQQHVLDLVNQGENVFYTGPAGNYAWTLSFFLMLTNPRYGQVCSTARDSEDSEAQIR